MISYVITHYFPGESIRDKTQIKITFFGFDISNITYPKLFWFSKYYIFGFVRILIESMFGISCKAVALSTSDKELSVSECSKKPVSTNKDSILIKKVIHHVMK